MILIADLDSKLAKRKLDWSAFVKENVEYHDKSEGALVEVVYDYSYRFVLLSSDISRPNICTDGMNF